MKNAITITLSTFTIWIVTSILNGIFCAVYFQIRERDLITTEPFFPVLLLSLLFSIPGFFFYWIVMLTRVYHLDNGRAIFRAAISTAFIFSCLTVLAFVSLSGAYNEFGFGFFIFPVLSAVISVMLHFNTFKNISTAKNNSD